MSEQEYSENEEDMITCIKENYTLDDFLKSKVTGQILYDDAVNKYENNVEKKVEDFYKKKLIMHAIVGQQFLIMKKTMTIYMIYLKLYFLM